MADRHQWVMPAICRGSCSGHGSPLAREDTNIRTASRIDEGPAVQFTAFCCLRDGGANAMSSVAGDSITVDSFGSPPGRADALNVPCRAFEALPRHAQSSRHCLSWCRFSVGPERPQFDHSAAPPSSMPLCGKQLHGLRTVLQRRIFSPSSNSHFGQLGSWLQRGYPEYSGKFLGLHLFAKELFFRWENCRWLLPSLFLIYYKD